MRAMFVILLAFFAGVLSDKIPATPNITMINNRTDGEITFAPNETVALECTGGWPLVWYMSFLESVSIFTPHGVIPDYVDNAFDHIESRTTSATSILYLNKDSKYLVRFYYCVSYAINSTLPDTDDLYPPLMKLVEQRLAARMYVFYDNGQLAVNDTGAMMPLQAADNEFGVIPCLPMNKNVRVTLQNEKGKPVDKAAYFVDPTLGAIMKVSSATVGVYRCVFNNTPVGEQYTVEIANQIPDKPEITGVGHFVQTGDQINLTCSSLSQLANNWLLEWHFPEASKAVAEKRVKHIIRTQDSLFDNLIVNDAKPSDTGAYRCDQFSKYESTFSAFVTHYISVKDVDCDIIITEKNNAFDIVVDIHKAATWVIYFDGRPEPLSAIWNATPETIDGKFETVNNLPTGAIKSTRFNIEKVTLAHMGGYQLTVSNPSVTNCRKIANFTLIVRSPPEVTVHSVTTVFGRKVSVDCRVDGYPAAQIGWTWSVCPLPDVNVTTKRQVGTWPTDADCQKAVTLRNFTLTTISPKRQSSTVVFQPEAPGRLTCSAKNSQTKAAIKRSATVYVIEDKAKVPSMAEPTRLAKGEQLQLRCTIERYNHTGLVWLKDGRPLVGNGHKSTLDAQPIALQLRLQVSRVIQANAGRYECVAIGVDRSRTTLWKHSVEVLDRVAPRIKGETSKKMFELSAYEQLDLSCPTVGMPVPEVQWWINNRRLVNSSNVLIDSYYTSRSDRGTMRNHTLTVLKVDDSFDGVLRCKANSSAGLDSREFTVSVSILTLMTKYTIGALCGTVFLIVVVCSGLLYRSYRKRSELLNLSDLAHLKSGNLSNLNPYSSLADQIDCLPYDDSKEFPLDRLKLSKEQLGCGNFGMVMKAWALDLEPRVEGGTPVAVKMVRHKNSDEEFQMLMKELKVMIHMGQHVNVINLVGAVTCNLHKRQLYVITEFCDRGGLQQYILKNTEGFVNQLNGDEIDATIRVAENPRTVYINTAPPATITTTDLVSWSYQVASGMAYLAKRGVLHGDLAARNILLCSNNVVKICDFGLSKAQQQDEDYWRENRTALPFRWLAIETMTHRVFNTNTDIWSFGIFLWELFSLGGRPYPELTDDCLYAQLCQGYRMTAPKYASPAIGQLIGECWNDEPTSRPRFEELADRLGAWLPPHQLRELIAMNAPFELENVATGRDRGDYLNVLRPEGGQRDYRESSRQMAVPTIPPVQSKGDVDVCEPSEAKSRMSRLSRLVGDEPEAIPLMKIPVRTETGDEDPEPPREWSTGVRIVYLKSVKTPWKPELKRTGLN